MPWKALTDTYERLDRAQEQGEVDRLYDELGRLIATGRDASLSQARTWKELRQVFQERGKLAPLEAKRLHDLNTHFSMEQGILLTTALMEAAKEVVKDRRVLGALMDRLIALLPPEGRREVVVDHEARE
jgi:hypothetical protein